MENKREAIHALVDKVLDVQENTKHYAEISISNVGHDAHVYVIEGGFDSEKDYSLQEDFDFDRSAVGVRLQRTLDYLDGLARDRRPKPESNEKETQG